MSYGQVRRSRMDRPGPLNPAENRKAGGFGPAPGYVTMAVTAAVIALAAVLAAFIARRDALVAAPGGVGGTSSPRFALVTETPAPDLAYWPSTISIRSPTWCGSNGSLVMSRR
jgi:hypothetical protein